MNIKYIIIDVDGTMTDGSIYYDENNNEMKKFTTRDAAGFFAANTAGISMIILTGRESNATLRRMRDLHVENIYQNVKDKKIFLENYIKNNSIDKSEIAYIGDDLNDYNAMSLAGFIACPQDAAEEIKEIANYISSVCGGNGVIRDVVKHILEEKGIWRQSVKSVYGIGC